MEHYLRSSLAELNPSGLIKSVRQPCWIAEQSHISTVLKARIQRRFPWPPNRFIVRLVRFNTVPIQRTKRFARSNARNKAAGRSRSACYFRVVIEASKSRCSAFSNVVGMVESPHRKPRTFDCLAL